MTREFAFACQLIKNFKEVKMNSKWHLYISLIKSAIRITSCILVFPIGMIALPIGLLIAEALGIFEEFGDKR